MKNLRRIEADENGYRKYRQDVQANRARYEKNLENRRRQYAQLPVYQDAFGVKYYYLYGTYWCSSKERFLELVMEMKPEPFVALRYHKYVGLFHTASETEASALKSFDDYDLLFFDPQIQTELIKVVSDLF